MTDYYLLRPEVPGHFGDETVLDNSTHPPVVHSLTYEFDGWIGDQILTSYPVILVTESLASDFEKAGASGYHLAPVKVRTTRQFRELYGSKKLPPFRWLQITGTPWEDDLFPSSKQRLIVSKKILDIILATKPKVLEYALTEKPVPSK
jgi:hypothetical protein